MSKLQQYGLSSIYAIAALSFLHLNFLRHQDHEQTSCLRDEWNLEAGYEVILPILTCHLRYCPSDAIIVFFLVFSLFKTN